MEIQQLKGFLAAAECGSVTHGAKRMGRSQPAVTRQIKVLEEELGTKLIERVGSRAALTEDGKLLRDIVAKAINEFDTIKSRFLEARGQNDAPSLTIATHSSVAEYLLPETISRFRKSYRNAKLSVLTRSRQDIVRMLQSGEADLGITSLDTVPANIEYNVFARYKRMLLVPRKHPLSKTRRISLKTLAQYPLILPSIGSNTRAAVEARFRDAGAPMLIALELTGREAAKRYVRMGLGLAILSEYYLTERDRQEFVTIDVSATFGLSERGTLLRKGKWMSKATLDFVDLLQHIAS